MALSLARLCVVGLVAKYYRPCSTILVEDILFVDLKTRIAK